MDQRKKERKKKARLDGERERGREKAVEEGRCD